MGGYTHEFWYRVNAGDGSTTVTVDLSGAASFQYDMNEWGGRAVSDPIDDSETGQGSATTTHTAASATPTVADDVALITYAFAGSFAVSAAPSGYTSCGTDGSYLKQYYKDLEGTDAENPQLTTVDAEDSGTILVLLKPTGGAPPAAPPSRAHAMLMLGVG
jgi:hypothetical protein